MGALQTDLELLVETRPLDPDLWRRLAQQYLADERFDDAIEAAGRAQRLCPPKDQAMVRQISELLEKLAQHPGGSAVQLPMAKTCLQANLADRAVVHVEAAAKKNSEDLASHKLLAELYWRVGRSEEAVDAYARVLWIAPDDIDAAMMLAERLIEVERTQSALMIVNRVRSKVPKTGQGELRIGRLLRLCGAAEAACWRLEKATALASDDPKAHYELAMAYIATERLHPAISELEEAIALDQEWNEPLRQVIKVYQSLGMKAEAEEAEARLLARPRLTVDLDTEIGGDEDEEDGKEITGKLELIPVPELLQFLAQRRLTGALSVSAPGGTGSVEIYEGSVVGAELQGSPTLQAQLLSDGIVTPETLEATGLGEEQGAGAFCAALVEWDLADPDQLRETCLNHVQKVLVELIGWSEGKVDFASTKVYTQTPTIQFEVQMLLMDTMRLIDEAAR